MESHQLAKLTPITLYYCRRVEEKNGSRKLTGNKNNIAGIAFRAIRQMHLGNDSAPHTHTNFSIMDCGGDSKLQVRLTERFRQSGNQLGKIPPAMISLLCTARAQLA